MGGSKRKQTLIKPTSSLPRVTPSLPTQYNFTPRATTDALPVGFQPSVKDYPPPKRLFQSANASPSQTSPMADVTRTPTPTLRGPRSSEARSSPTEPVQSSDPPRQSARVSLSEDNPSPQSQPRAAPSPHSSHAQNSHVEEEDEMADDAEAPGVGRMEPNLSEAQLAALNNLLENRTLNKHLVVLDPDHAPGTTW